MASRSSSRSGELIISLMSEKDVTQTQLSLMTNTSPSQVSHVVTGRRLPSADWLDLVSSSLSLDEDARRSLHGAAVEDLAARSGYYYKKDG